MFWVLLTYWPQSGLLFVMTFSDWPQSEIFFSDNNATMYKWWWMANPTYCDMRYLQMTGGGLSRFNPRWKWLVIAGTTMKPLKMLGGGLSRFNPKWKCFVMSTWYGSVKKHSMLSTLLGGGRSQSNLDRKSLATSTRYGTAVNNGWPWNSLWARPWPSDQALNSLTPHNCSQMMFLNEGYSCQN